MFSKNTRKRDGKKVKKISTNKKTAITIVITVILTEFSKMLMTTTKWEASVLFMLIFLCIRVLFEE